MEKRTKKSIFYTMAFLTLIFFVFNSLSFAQEKEVDREKIYKEITGKYELDTGDQIMIVSIWVEDGKLFAAPEDEDPGELAPVKGKELVFEIETPDGQYFDLTFVRDDKGKITKFILGIEGMEFEAPRIEEEKKNKE